MADNIIEIVKTGASETSDLSLTMTITDNSTSETPVDLSVDYPLVTMRFRKRGTTTPIHTETGSIIDEVNGVVLFVFDTFLANDPAPGRWEAEIEIRHGADPYTYQTIYQTYQFLIREKF